VRRAWSLAQFVQHSLGEPGRVVVAAGQLLALGRERLVQQRLRPGHRPVEVAPPHRFAAHPPGPRGQVVQATAALFPSTPRHPARQRSAPQQVAQRLPQAAAVEHLRADLVDRGTHVVRRGERVGAALPGAVPVAVGRHD
jgi:hypothetical protein